MAEHKAAEQRACPVPVIVEPAVARACGHIEPCPEHVAAERETFTAKYWRERAKRAETQAASLLTERDALVDVLIEADRDIGEWVSLAKRQQKELPDCDHLPCGPTSAGIAASERIQARVSAVLRGNGIGNDALKELAQKWRDEASASSARASELARQTQERGMCHEWEDIIVMADTLDRCADQLAALGKGE